MKMTFIFFLIFSIFEPNTFALERIPIELSENEIFDRLDVAFTMPLKLIGGEQGKDSLLFLYRTYSIDRSISITCGKKDGKIYFVLIELFSIPKFEEHKSVIVSRNREIIEVIAGNILPELKTKSIFMALKNSFTFRSSTGVGVRNFKRPIASSSGSFLYSVPSYFFARY